MFYSHDLTLDQIIGAEPTENIEEKEKQIVKDIHSLLGLYPKENSFSIGEIIIFENDSIVLYLTDQYYEKIVNVYLEVVKLFNSGESGIDYEYGLQREAQNCIKKKMILPYNIYKALFKANFDVYRYNKDGRFDLVSYYPKNDTQHEDFKNQPYTEFKHYKNLMRNIGPNNIKRKLNNNLQILLNEEYFLTHTYLVAKSGYGKSVLILELSKNLIDLQNSSYILLEPHEDLSDELLSLIEKERLNKDVVLIDPFLEDGYIPTINLFEIGENPTLSDISTHAGAIVSVFKEVIGSSFSPAMESLLTPIVSVLLQLNSSSFFDMMRFLSDKNNKELLYYAQNYALNPAHREYFKTIFLEKRTGATKLSIATKLQVLLNDPIFANFLCGKSTLDLESLINTKGKIIIIKLNKVKMENTIEAVGKFLFAIITSYAFKRENQHKNDRIMTHFHVDEAPVFVSDNSSVNSILEQARKYKLSLLLSSQYNSQFSSSIHDSILSNTNVKIVGYNSNKNHRIMAPELNCDLDQLDNLTKKGEFYFKIGSNKSFKMIINNRYTDIKPLSTTRYEEFKYKQLNHYYRKIDSSNIQYATIPLSHEDSEDLKKQTTKEKNYTKEVKSKLQQELLDNENQLVGF